MTKVVFQGDAPTVDGKLFTNITPYVYYPQNNKTWTKEVIDAYNDNATWIAYNPAAEDVLSDAYPGGEPQSCVEWYFDEETSTLIFSGRGDMEDYYAAWKEWRSETQKVIFEEGITDIGNYAFEGTAFEGIADAFQEFGKQDSGKAYARMPYVITVE